MNKGTLLRRMSARYLAKYPRRLFLSILGIAIGVAMIVAIDLANQSATQAFDYSIEKTSGKATHLISNPGSLIPSDYLMKLQQMGVVASPEIEVKATMMVDEQQLYPKIIGVDFRLEEPFRSIDVFQNQGIDRGGSSSPNGISDYYSGRPLVITNATTADHLGITTDQNFEVDIDGEKRSIVLDRVWRPADDNSQGLINDMVFCDISFAQQLKRQPAGVDRIKLIIPEEVSIAAVEAILDPAFILEDLQGSRGFLDQVTSSFRQNLEAVSLLALLVGMFLIYNSSSFSVLQRRKEIALLKSLGMQPKEILSMFLKEVFVIGLIGSFFGLALGIVLATILTQLIAGTINDLYFELQVTQVSLNVWSLAKGLLMGIIASLVAAFVPAWNAAKLSTVKSRSRAWLEARSKALILTLAKASIGLTIAGLLLLLVNVKSINLGYIATLFITLGFLGFTPLFASYIIKGIIALAKRTTSLFNQMAFRDIASQQSRIILAVAAMTLALSTTIGVGSMVGSFRNTVISWLETRLMDDIYISRMDGRVSTLEKGIPLSMAKILETHVNVDELHYFTELKVPNNDFPLRINALNLSKSQLEAWQFKSQMDDSFDLFKAGKAVMVSEPFAYKHDLKAGDLWKMKLGGKTLELPIAGVYYDYVTDVGRVTMDLEQVNKYIPIDEIAGISVTLKSGTDRADFMAEIPGLFQMDDLEVRSNADIRALTLELFDRTFMITNVLQFLAIIVAFVAIINALMSIQLDRARDFAIFRANGLAKRSLFKMINLQSMTLGLVSGLLAVPLGLILAMILIHIINYRSFGWTLNYVWDGWLLVSVVVFAVVAALLAGLYPAYKISQTPPHLAMKEE